jgi:CAAX protease family protein
MTLIERHPWIPYVVPFAAFMAVLGAAPYLGLELRGLAVVRSLVPAIVILLVARPVLDLRASRPWTSVGIGIGVFLLWIAPDELFPGYRSGGLFQNGIVGRLESSVPVAGRTDPVIIVLRGFRAVIVVPIVEELFWRGWLPRWLDRSDDFRARALGAFSTFSFVASAGLFAVEHGSFWDVGLAAGIAYNAWMAKTRRLGDLILCHAVTNGCLGAWVLATGQWRYW